MAIDLPKPILDYFQADKVDGVAVADCFTDTSTVTDEGNIHSGRRAIRDWKTESSQKYDYTAEPVAIAEADGKSVVTTHVVGDFPGSPTDLRFFFVIAGDKIASLEIKA